MAFHHFSVILPQNFNRKGVRNIALITARERAEKYGKLSIYPTGRMNKKGQDVYDIAFYYDDIHGNKKRKVFTGDREELEKKGLLFCQAFTSQSKEQRRKLFLLWRLLPLLHPLLFAQ